MSTVTIQIIIETQDKDATARAALKYLQETLEQSFLEPGEKIQSIDIIEEE